MGFGSGLRILVVDDIEDVRFAVKENLGMLGFTNVYTAFDGMNALEVLQEAHASNEDFELILCDYDMPNLHGIDFFKAMQATFGSSCPKFILMSGVSDKTFIQVAMTAGIRSILLKPFSQQNLVNTINKFF